MFLVFLGDETSVVYDILLRIAMPFSFPGRSILFDWVPSRHCRLVAVSVVLQKSGRQTRGAQAQRHIHRCCCWTQPGFSPVAQRLGRFGRRSYHYVSFPRHLRVNAVSFHALMLSE